MLLLPLLDAAAHRALALAPVRRGPCCLLPVLVLLVLVLMTMLMMMMLFSWEALCVKGCVKGCVWM